MNCLNATTPAEPVWSTKVTDHLVTPTPSGKALIDQPLPMALILVSMSTMGAESESSAIATDDLASRSRTISPRQTDAIVLSILTRLPLVIARVTSVGLPYRDGWTLARS